MITDELQSALAAIASDTTLAAEAQFERRAEAIDELDFQIIDRIEHRSVSTPPSVELLALKGRAETLLRRLEAIDEALFRRLRGELRAGGHRGRLLRRLVNQYVDLGTTVSQSARAGYDSLDRLVNGLLGMQAIPVELRALEPEMVSYQQTPARVIFELAERAQLTRDDVFYDLGSGLGHVPILVHLLSGAPARGVELEPAYCERALRCAAELNLTEVQLVNADARTADYADGTVFFLYTPFEGMMLQAVLLRLKQVAQGRTVRLFTYGPCTRHVLRQGWLEHEGQADEQRERLHAFRSK